VEDNPFFSLIIHACFFFFYLFYFFFLVLLGLLGGPFSLSHASINDQETPFFSLHFYIIFNQRPTLLPLRGGKKICAKEAFVQSFFGIVLYLFIISFLIFFSINALFLYIYYPLALHCILSCTNHKFGWLT